MRSLFATGLLLGILACSLPASAAEVDVAGLLKSLSSPTESVRLSAIDRLGRAGPKAAKPTRCTPSSNTLRMSLAAFLASFMSWPLMLPVRSRTIMTSRAAEGVAPQRPVLSFRSSGVSSLFLGGRTRQGPMLQILQHVPPLPIGHWDIAPPI